MATSVAVIGAGVIGLSTAILAQQKVPDLQVTIISDKFSPETTGDVSAGLWLPHCLKDTPQSDIVRWSGETYAHMLKLWRDVDASDAGICLVPKYELSDAPGAADSTLPEWSEVPLAYQNLNRSQAQKLSASNKFTGGTYMITFTLEPSRYLPYLTNKFKLNGGKIEQRKVQNLQELCGHYDVVINCCGIGAHHLLRDNLIGPIRGQVLRVRAPWLFTSVSEQSEDGKYIIPNMDDVILGGTHQEGDWNTSPDPNDSKTILEGCYRLIPALRDAEIVSDRAGLRPGRTCVRLERGDQVTDKHGNTLQVIHNYGHGGSGVTLSWGCAIDAVDILQDILNSQSPVKKFKSKL